MELIDILYVSTFILFSSWASLPHISDVYNKPLRFIIAALISYINLDFYYNCGIAYITSSNLVLFKSLYVNYYPELISVIIILKYVDYSFFSHNENDKEPLVFFQILYSFLKYSNFHYFHWYVLIEAFFVLILKKIKYLSYSASRGAGLFMALLLILRGCFLTLTEAEGMVLFFTLFFFLVYLLMLCILKDIKFENFGDVDHNSRMLNFLKNSEYRAFFFFAFILNLEYSIIVFFYAEFVLDSNWKILSVYSILAFSVTIASLLNWDQGNKILMRFSSNGLSIALTLFGVAYYLGY